MKMVIVVPFEGAGKMVNVWANEEEEIDFRHEHDKAARCTLSFAAVEIERHLAKTLLDTDIIFATHCEGEYLSIHLAVIDHSSKDESFTLEPLPYGVRILGQGRTGVLYGAYEFLRLQGWRWFAPGSNGEIAPEVATSLKLPAEKKLFSPSFKLGRGFIFEDQSKESADLYLWMARNRLNLSGYRPNTGSLCEKLGMSPVIGGHIFEKILDPNRMLPSGKTMWEEHQEWYGIPKDGTRQKEKALRTQFCVSQDSLMKFLSDELLVLLKGKWKNSDRIDIWGFDTWGATCDCAKCRALGNGSDQTLHFISQLRSAIDNAVKTKELDHNVRLALCAYEGTATISAPERAIPQNLLDAGDYVLFAPINRCYCHEFSSSACSWNEFYHQKLASWISDRRQLPVMVNEYYNVSKFEDLPLLFTEKIAADLPAYHAQGVSGITYMHVPFVNWGMRTLTQLLYAQLAWDTRTDVASFLEEYFRCWYGLHARQMRTVYELIEESWRYASQWRAWSLKSVLTQLIDKTFFPDVWKDDKQVTPLPGNDHLSYAAIVPSGRNSIQLIEKALSILNKAIKKERKRLAAHDEMPNPSMVNPLAMREWEARRNSLEKRLCEDRRLLRYGLDTMRIMTEIVAYHEALNQHDLPKANTIWRIIEKVADNLDSYYMPISYEQPGPGLVSRDALTRTQLRDCINHCRKGQLS